MKTVTRIEAIRKYLGKGGIAKNYIDPNELLKLWVRDHIIFNSLAKKAAKELGLSLKGEE